jgi:hypothetical protein
MLGDDAFILDRHLIARERDHPSALGAVPLVERKGFERLGRFGRARVDFVAHRALRVR